MNNNDKDLSENEVEERDKIWKELYEKYPIDKQVQFSELDIQEKLRNQPFLLLHYSDLYYKEKAKYDKMIEVLDKIQGTRYDYYKFNSDKELTKYEIEKFYLPKDPTLLKAKEKVRKQQWRVDFFKMCYDAINNQGWQLKSFIEGVKQGLL
ncbi:MAG TPA: recombination mediator protein UvsY [Bacteroidales bacterium]|nr:recombination mediator protein UvsY [Bacteroidales bacterium]